MTFESKDKEQLKKLGVQTLLDLALIIPHRYENLYLSKTLTYGKNHVIEATIQTTSYHPKYFKFTSMAHNLNQQIDGIIFHPRKYHHDRFKSGERLYLYGKIEQNFETLQIVQPQIVDEINTIVPKYKSKLQNKTVIKFIKKYLTQDNLIQAGLDEKKYTILLGIHFPSIPFIDHFENEGFSRETILFLKYLEVYNHLQKLSTKKVDYPAKKSLDADIDDWIGGLPFTLTNDQQKAIDEIASDFKKPIATKRVIMGDVGCGKTMVIFASAMMARPSRAILMAPTTVLASQIYEEAQKFLPQDMKIGYITNKTKKNEDLDQYDFLIGTHALLYKELPDADLIMIDEQHRFGTKQRAMIAKLVSEGEKQPHFLQFSATPIPRTLSMMQSSIIDISQIKELPFKKDIDTQIMTKEDFSSLVEHIKDEIDHGRQIIIVYPLVEESEVIEYQSIEQARGYWEKNFEKVYVTFGKDKEKDETLNAFKEDGNILIATTLVEVGVSLPNLSTIVLVAPERLGLASLHQLRGRVSRNGLKGYCYLFTKHPDNERLKSFCETLDGFEIAELDLQFRQGGDLLKGDLQSGKHFKWFDPKSDAKILSYAKEELKRSL